MRGIGMGMVANQLADLKLGELLDTPPPGLDEAVATAKVSTHGFGSRPPNRVENQQSARTFVPGVSVPAYLWFYVCMML
eukprot:1160217-Pelagomonas_calceolata.AAC.16